MTEAGRQWQEHLGECIPCRRGADPDVEGDIDLLCDVGRRIWKLEAQKISRIGYPPGYDYTEIADVALIERLAAQEHERWSHWMTYLFSRCRPLGGAMVIPTELVERWTRQALTPYGELSEQEKETDRKEARRTMEVVEGHPVPATGVDGGGLDK